jgi:hypothetical protein
VERFGEKVMSPDFTETQHVMKYDSTETIADIHTYSVPVTLEKPMK